MLQQGGFSFVTLIHEFGHGMGLAHPHDTGGGSSIMPGVVTSGVPGDDGGAGTYLLNQGIFTMMSYNDGWERSPYGQAETNNEGYGWLGSLMALDIAVIQDKYGVNEDWATGDDTYVLKDVNEWGVYIDAATGQPAQHDATNATTSRDGYYVGQSTFYSSIWDAGGVDQIIYSGTRNTNIDLRPATLGYEIGGGGWVSYATGIYGGFTIANGATIENARTDAGNDSLRGNGVNNRLESGAGNDIVYLQDGGDDIVVAGDGNDVLIFGAAMTGLDQADGGAGNDQIALQGNYTLTLGAQVVSFESLAILPGSDTRFGDPGTNFYDYDLTMVDANVAAGVTMVVDANRLRIGEDFTFNGSAETDGAFFIYGGGGTDTLTGGSRNDVFYFGEGGQFGASDHVDGGSGGIDQLGLRGNYTIVFGATQLIGIESIGMVSAQDTRFGALGSNYNYNLTMNNGNLAAGVRMTIDAAPLRPNETLVFNGGAEADGSFRVFGGQGDDVITGSQNGDILSGGLGADTLSGGGGNDVFLYRSVAESTSAGRDGIQDFNLGDILDLSRIDANTGAAGDQAFSWIGSDAFHNVAGELRATVSGTIWTVQGDVNGDGVADIEFVVNVTDTAIHPLGSGDFFL
jgi:hypothetical protein